MAFRFCSIRRTTNLNTNSTAVAVSFDTEEIDDDGCWVIGSPTRITIPAAYNGKRAVFYANGIWQNNTGYNGLWLRKNGSATDLECVVQIRSNAFNTAPCLVSRPLLLATGDYYELMAISAAADVLLTADDYSTTFAMEVRFS